MSQTNPTVSKTCVNCNFGRMVSTFARCTECLDTAKTGNQFPNWEPKGATNADA